MYVCNFQEIFDVKEKKLNVVLLFVNIMLIIGENFVLYGICIYLLNFVMKDDF